MLQGRRVLVGVCGSIAAYKAAEVVRGLIKGGADVRVVMTDSATKFVAPATFAALTGYAVPTDLFAEPERVVHVELGRWAEGYLVCGATASTLERLASGSGEDVVSAAYLMCRCPVVAAPAMHTEMWEHPSVQRNVEQLTSDGVLVVAPEEGDLASGDYGVGRLADPLTIIDEVSGALTHKDLTGVRVLVTAGPTREPLDPVRFVSNRSTGRMGFELAREARRRGARVVVVAGPTSTPSPAGMEVVRVETAEQMLAECLDRYEDTDIAVLNAAVADWRPSDPAAQKVKKAKMGKSIPLEPTPDIAAELGRKKGTQTLVLFAAETESLIPNAEDKLRSKLADMVVANAVGKPGTGFDSETNDAVIISAQGAEQLPRLRKDELSVLIWDRIVQTRAATRSVD
ncbi:MAG TPA: bifunctional phosphopantothenoylcysteine decarboxylase/phosphopantothenate--cysteine ligase CoaBC [Actinomycetota bacterium]|jgi:phosphopantothenoylcysteine decarboxylase/phosphopantothenate--cysteine ligase|nr:bifunctional phosphopantothenoylcysteine decarboxylase/phosphopantothenate--cysteine ligase CoaBC [Actinomycetota bacterium]